MEWGQANNFIWLWSLLAVAAVLALSDYRKRSAARRFGEEPLIQRLMQSFSPARRLFKRLLTATAVFLMIIALCQPHFRQKETLVQRRGIDVVIAIDVSNSMLAKDVAPNRLEKAKLELSGLIDKLRGDRIGIIAFAQEAFIQCPLTLDKGAVKLFLSTVSPNLVKLQGTSLSRAIDTALVAFADKDKGRKAVILLTDGEDHEGEAIEAARRAAKMDASVFTIGIGTPEGRTIPADTGADGFKKGRDGKVIISKLNESLLKQIARESGGRYYRAARGELEVDSIARELRKMAQKDLSSQWSVEYEESYQFFLLLAFALLLIEMALSETRQKAQSGPSAAALRKSLL